MDNFILIAVISSILGGLIGIFMIYRIKKSIPKNPKVKELEKKLQDLEEEFF